MRLVVFGANGPTGRLLTAQALAAGYDTVAVTRQPDTFPLREPGLRVHGGDVLDQATVDSAVEGGDAVLSALGVPCDLAMLRQLGDASFSRRIGHVITTDDNPSLLSTMLREARRK